MTQAGQNAEDTDETPADPAADSLLLLMANLAQLDDPQVIERLFVGAIGRIFDGLVVTSADVSDIEGARQFDLATARRSFGAITVRPTRGAIDERTAVLLRNAAHMVALILENLASRTAAERERDNFFEISEDLLCVTSEKGIFLQANPAWKRCLGWSRNELRGKPFLDFVHPDDVGETLGATDVLKAGHAVHGFQNRYRCRDGTYRWLDWTSILDSGKLYAVARDVTDRRRAEAALRESEERFSKAFMASPAAIAITRMEDSLYYDVNSRWLSILGYDREEVIGRTSVDLGIWDDKAQRAAYIERLRRQGTVDSFEAVFVTKDGRRRTVVLAAETLEIAGETCVLGAFHDITERKTMEQALRESEARLRAVFDNTPVCLNLKATDGRYLLINKPYEEWLGFAAADIIGKAAREFLPPSEEVDNLDAAERRVLETAEPVIREVHVPRGDQVFHRILIKFPVKSAEGRVMSIGTVAVDVTDRVRVEEALRASEERFRRLYEESPLPYQSLDGEGRLVEVNQAWLDLFGYRRDDVTGRGFADFLQEDRRRSFVRHFSEFMKAGQTHHPGYEVVCRDGSIRTVSIDGRLGRGLDGRVAQAHCILTDITDRLRAEERLRQAQKLEAVGQLAGGTAHDFNNLLQVVMSNLELLSRMIDAEDRGQALVDNAAKAVRRGARLTQQLLSFSRRQALRPEIVHPASLIRGMLDMFERTLGEDIEIETVFEDRLPAIVVDPHGLENALLNIALNARSAMPEGGRFTIRAGRKSLEQDLQLEDAVLPAGDYVEISLADTGCGMTQEVMTRAFDPFFTTKEVGQGSGLGLSMVYGFAKQSRGTVSLESRLGQGTTVRIVLPAA